MPCRVGSRAMRPRRGREFGARPTARDCCVSSLLYPPPPSPLSPSLAPCGHGPGGRLRPRPCGRRHPSPRPGHSLHPLALAPPTYRCRPVASHRSGPRRPTRSPPSTMPDHSPEHHRDASLTPSLADTSSRPRSPSTPPRPLPAHNPSSIPTRRSTPSSSWAPCGSTASARLCRSSTASTNMSSPR